MSKEVSKYRTNINCGNCVAKIKTVLDCLPGICYWQVDLTNPKKILTIESIGLSQEEIIETVQKVGYQIEPLN
ncbi:MAG: heavy-metal-associated domain-containing protein [Bacteroidia bacterium]